MRKQYILYIATISILSLVYINNTSALDYSSNVGIGFTFNPTLSINISSSDLVISNLKPGTTEDSNSINVSIATNAAYGYNLSATVGSNTYNNTSLNNINSSDNNDNNNNNDSSNYAFNSIATNADLPSLATDNTWGYSYSLDNGSTWSNYSGLPLFSDNNNKTLVDRYTQSEDTINFKIGAKASTTQPSGTYSSVINFNAVSYAVPMSLADSYAYFGAELYHGYYKMQDMTTRICQTTEAPSELQVIDVRDDKVYWIAKLADGNCWMTQNLDLDIDGTKTYTHQDTDLGWDILNNNDSWLPGEKYFTTRINGTEVENWQSNTTYPWSGDPGDIYYYTSDSSNTDTIYTSLQSCTKANHDDCAHYHSGNYYNWPAASAGITSVNQSIQESTNSICPAGWRLPKTRNDELKQLLLIYDIIDDNGSYETIGFTRIRENPLYFTRAGRIYSSSIDNRGKAGYYYYSTYYENTASNFYLFFSASELSVSTGSGRFARSIRCLAR